MPIALIVEDDQSTRLLYRKILEKVQFKVYEAEDGVEGLQMLKKQKYDVIILDLHMPKMDGEQVMIVLNKRKESLPVIVVSAHLTKERILKMAKLGVKEFLQKPFEIRNFYQTVNRVYPIKVQEA
ncbi:hypothetical protein AMJ80_11140 [bacterium SM23_31]|nr:MAG: hypothetical protein AMJ80_11140 [bacterium SM23_31]